MGCDTEDSIDLVEDREQWPEAHFYKSRRLDGPFIHIYIYIY